MQEECLEKECLEKQKHFVTPIMTKKRYANISEKLNSVLEEDMDKMEKILKVI